MTRPPPAPGRPAALALAAALLVVLAPRAAAQTLVYGLNEHGTLCVNGTVLDSLKSDFNETFDLNTEQRWWDLQALGADRYALRLDGRVAKNGKNLFSLPFVSANGAPLWQSLAVTATAVHALRSDGLLSTNGTDAQNLPEGTFFFVRCLGAGPDVYSLRSDGAVFRNVAMTAKIQFVGGPGAGGAPDGFLANFTDWIAVAAHPVSGEIFALRRDGKLWRADPADFDTDPIDGELEVALPAPTSPVSNDELYCALDFLADGTWHVLRGDGAVFTSKSALTPLIDLPGSASTDADTYTDLRTTDTGFFAVRWDGRVFDEGGVSQLFDMLKLRYHRLALSDTPPDLTSFKNPAPVAARYKTRALEGVSVSVPILVSDIEKLPADIVVTAPDPLPPGATWDDLTRTLTWASPGPVGTHKFVVTADDGENPIRTFKHKIKVLAADADPLKNKPPLPTKVTTVQALVDFPISFPILAVDPDGDPLTVTVNTAKAPFTLGATFDAPSNTFTWTPTFDDIGTVIVNFKVSDGVKTVKLAVPVKVVNSLIF